MGVIIDSICFAFGVFCLLAALASSDIKHVVIFSACSIWAIITASVNNKKD